MALTTGREIDFSSGLNQSALDGFQFQYLRNHIGHPIQYFGQVSQVHGNDIVEIKNKTELAKGIPQADGIMTNLKHTALLIRTADCLPIFIYDSTIEAIGLIHAGWRGSHQNIVIKAIHKMAAEYGSNTKNIQALFGPCIGSCCYEVGEEFNRYFPSEVVVRGSRLFLDLKAVNRNQLLSLGVAKENIKDVEICTCCNKQYFSYRREGAKAGRMVSLMMIRQR